MNRYKGRHKQFGMFL